MPIRFVCPLCWAVRDNVDDASLGKIIKCHDCHAMSVAQHTPAPRYATTLSPNPPAFTWTEAPVRNVPAVPTVDIEQTPVSLSRPDPARIEAEPRVLFSTGDLRVRYRIVDLVFAHGTSTQGSLKGVHAGEAFKIMVEWLSRAARQLGADAVIHTHIDFRPGLEPNAFEVYAYGTAVKVEEPTSTP